MEEEEELEDTWLGLISDLLGRGILRRRFRGNHTSLGLFRILVSVGFFVVIQ